MPWLPARRSSLLQFANQLDFMFVTPDMVRMNIEDEAQYNPIFAFLDREFDNWAVNEKLAKVAHFVWRVLVFGEKTSFLCDAMLIK